MEGHPKCLLLMSRGEGGQNPPKPAFVHGYPLTNPKAGFWIKVYDWFTSKKFKAKRSRDTFITLQGF